MTVTRLNSIAYAGTTFGVGGTGDLHGVHITRKDYESFEVSAVLVLVETSTANLLTAASAVETAFRTPRGDLTVTLGPSVFFTGTHAANTFMNGAGQATLLESHRTNLTRAYAIRAVGQLPADNTGDVFKRSASIQVDSDDAGIRTVAIEAEYTASAAPSLDSARGNLETDFGTFVTATLTDVDPAATWDSTQSQRINYDWQNKVARASTAYRELISEQAVGVTDSATLVGLQVSITVLRESELNLTNTGAKPLVSAEVVFSTAVDKDQSTDLDAVVESTIIPHLRALVISDADATGTAVTIFKRVDVDPQNNRVSGRVGFLIRGSVALVRLRISTDEPKTSGITLVPIMDGEPFSRDEWAGPKFHTAVVSLDVIALRGSENRGISELEKVVRQIRQRGFVELERPRDYTESFTREVEGTGETIDFVQRQVTVVLERADVGGGTSSGGGGAGGGSYVPGKNIRNG